jgi:ABC-type uncharacterized transport system substrate-binding protein
VELLKQIAPHVTRAVVLRDPTTAAGIGQFAAIQSAAQSLTVELTPVGLRDLGEIERTVAALARANGSMIVTVGGGAGPHRKLLIGLAARHKLPAAYPFRYYVKDGGLISYGPDAIDLHRRAASYVDRILKGRSLPTCRYRRQPSTILCSTSKPPRRSASTCRHRCSPAPTR